MYTQSTPEGSDVILQYWPYRQGHYYIKAKLISPESLVFKDDRNLGSENYFFFLQITDGY